MIIPDALVVDGIVFVEVDAVDEVAVAAVVTLGIGLVPVDTITGAVDVISCSVVTRAVVTK
jgi:hypothetical protein